MKTNKYRLEELLDAIKRFSKIKACSPPLTQLNDFKIKISKPIDPEPNKSVFESPCSDKEEFIDKSQNLGHKTQDHINQFGHGEKAKKFQSMR